MALFCCVAAPARATDVTDSEALAIVQKHCVMCHSDHPTHESFQQAPKNITLDTVGALKMQAAAIYVQTIQTRAMPLANQTGMTGPEREALGRWLKDQK